MSGGASYNRPWARFFAPRINILDAVHNGHVLKYLSTHWKSLLCTLGVQNARNYQRLETKEPGAASGCSDARLLCWPGYGKPIKTDARMLF